MVMVGELTLNLFDLVSHRIDVLTRLHLLVLRYGRYAILRRRHDPKDCWHLRGKSFFRLSFKNQVWEGEFREPCGFD